MKVKQIDEIRTEGFDNGAHFAYHTTVLSWAKADATISGFIERTIQSARGDV